MCDPWQGFSGMPRSQQGVSSAQKRGSYGSSSATLPPAREEVFCRTPYTRGSAESLSLSLYAPHKHMRRP